MTDPALTPRNERGPDAPQIALLTHDAALVAGIRAGDVAAFEALFFAFYDRLVSVARRYVRSQEAAEELAQDVFCRLWQSRSTWVVHTSVRAYLYALVRNAALNEAQHLGIVAQCEGEALRMDRSFFPGMSASAAAEADTRVLAGEVAVALARATQALPPRVRQAYALRIDHELTYAEVAEAMGVTVKAVEKLLTRAHAALRRALAAYR